MDKAARAGGAEVYTVFRLLGTSTSLASSVAAIDTREPGVITPRARLDGFASDICEQRAWTDHETAIGTYIERHGEAIQDALSKGASASFDVMVEAEDLQSVLPYVSLNCSARLLRLLATSGATLAFSIYATEEPDD